MKPPTDKGDEMDNFGNYERLDMWDLDDGVRLELYDTFTTDRMGKCRLAYRFYDHVWYGDTPIFEGEDFYCSPMHCVDSDETAASVLTFLTLKPGDTDPEYFDDYTEDQLNWCQDRAEELSIFAYELRGEL